MPDAPNRLALTAMMIPAAAFLLVAAVALGERVGTEPLAWRPRNIVEAAAVGDGAFVLRELRAGADPRAPLPVRPGILTEPIRRATAVEAAVWAGRVELFEIVHREVGLGDAERLELACLAADRGQPELSRHLSAGTMPACVPGRALARVAARTTGVIR